MESFAFWYKERENESGVSVSDESGELAAHVHFNLWCECGWKKEKEHLQGTDYPYLDIGFRVKRLSKAQALFFFLPFSITEAKKMQCIEDLGRKFLENALLADALFNDSHHVTISANKKEIDVRCTSKDDHFKIYQLDIVNDISLEAFGEGTILEIKTGRILSNMDESEQESDYYFRFRIKNQPLDFLIHRYKPPTGVIQGLFNTTYMIDFRYHNIRGLHNTLVERFHEKLNHPVPVQQLHFFLMTKAYVDVSNTNFKVRKIEQDVWKDYVDGLDTEDLVAYHYADKPKTESNSKYIDSSELFAKFRVEQQVIWRYVLITLGLGAVGSLLGSSILALKDIIWQLICKFLLTPPT
ncbi:hypothetical protein D7X94_05305 [Acutalibacter sp. 1XD8-33]|uniref:hypothetical protein n=1 Tax=Acutalibacter sp. 1XD8-33 TaxID=2320081 RepID=UPI000EA2A8D5|nr:hypothetical protein [Acutalibacter sp. 1XD8-33]RKJ41213.1 hypothetical protein D7X94_05305 [Acutalibacter sp. 1XD8-33]